MLTLATVIPITPSNRISPHDDDPRRKLHTRNPHSSNTTRTPPHTASADTTHNLHTDIPSAAWALRMVHRPRLVLSEHTAVPQLRITAEHPLYRRVSAPGAGSSAEVLADGLGTWFGYQRGRGLDQGSWMHDVLTLAAALDLPFVPFTPACVSVRTHACTTTPTAVSSSSAATGSTTPRSTTG